MAYGSMYGVGPLGSGLIAGEPPADVVVFPITITMGVVDTTTTLSLVDLTLTAGIVDTKTTADVVDAITREAA